MATTNLLAQCTVSDLEAARDFYSRLFGRLPDASPMPGLLEWYLGEASGVQVWEEPARAGFSSVVLGESDLDAIRARLDDAGIAHDGVQDASSSQLLMVVDADGNRIVFTGPTR